MTIRTGRFQRGRVPWNKIPVDVNQLELLYNVKGLSLEETASELDISFNTVRRKLIEAGIETRKRGARKGVSRSFDKSFFKTPEYRMKQSVAHKGKECTEERKQKISLAQRGKRLSEEHKKTLSLAHIGIQAGEKSPWYGKHRSAETKAKIRAKVSGDKNPHWRGGFSRKYAKEFHKELRGLIRQRDNYTCKLCGVPEIECVYPLGVHHIDYDKMNSLPSNLVTLCNKCNSKVNFNRDFWTEYFTKRVLL